MIPGLRTLRDAAKSLRELGTQVKATAEESLLRHFWQLTIGTVPVVPHVCDTCDAKPVTSVTRSQHKHHVEHGAFPCRCGGALVAAWRLDRP